MNRKNTYKRVFKTSWFSRMAKKAKIKDSDLCEAIQEVMDGQAVDLGGGVFKKRLNNNQHRSIILAKGDFYWIYEYLFAKKDRDNIHDNELVDFRKLAKLYAGLTAKQVEQLLHEKSLIEVCYEQKK